MSQIPHVSATAEQALQKINIIGQSLTYLENNVFTRVCNEHLEKLTHFVEAGRVDYAKLEIAEFINDIGESSYTILLKAFLDDIAKILSSAEKKETAKKRAPLCWGVDKKTSQRCRNTAVEMIRNDGAQLCESCLEEFNKVGGDGFFKFYRI